MRTGVILWFDKKKGYGFLQDVEDDTKSYFFHYTAIKKDDEFKSYEENDKVYYEVGTAPNGKECAVSVAPRD